MQRSELTLVTHSAVVSLQKWNNVQRLLMLDDGAMSGKCLDVDPETKMLVIQHCDSTKESQHWTYHINSPAQ